MKKLKRVNGILWHNNLHHEFQWRVDPFPFRGALFYGGGLYRRVATAQKGSHLSEWRHNGGFMRAHRRSAIMEILYGCDDQFRSRLKSRSWKDCSKRDHQWKESK